MAGRRKTEQIDNVVENTDAVVEDVVDDAVVVPEDVEIEEVTTSNEIEGEGEVEVEDTVDNDVTEEVEGVGEVESKAEEPKEATSHVDEEPSDDASAPKDVEAANIKATTVSYHPKNPVPFYRGPREGTAIGYAGGVILLHNTIIGNFVKATYFSSGCVKLSGYVRKSFVPNTVLSKLSIISE